MSAESYTKTTESGAFIRTTYRKGKRRKQESKRMQKNEEKVVLGYIGDFEVYVYPYNYPDTVFIGTFPVSTQLNAGNLSEMFVVYNRAKWFLQGFWEIEPEKSKGAKSRRQRILLAYNSGLEHVKELQKRRI